MPFCNPARDSATLLALLSAYFALVAPVLVVVGTFVGPTIFFGGILHLTLSIILLTCRHYLLLGRRWAKVLSLTVVLVIFGIAIVAAVEIALHENIAAIIFPMLLATLTAILALLLININHKNTDLTVTGHTSESDGSKEPPMNGTTEVAEGEIGADR